MPSYLRRNCRENTCLLRIFILGYWSGGRRWCRRRTLLCSLISAQGAFLWAPLFVLTSVGAELVTICICKIPSSGKIPVTLSAKGNSGDVAARFLKMLCNRRVAGGKGCLRRHTVFPLQVSVCLGWQSESSQQVHPTQSSFDPTSRKKQSICLRRKFEFFQQKIQEEGED